MQLLPSEVIENLKACEELDFRDKCGRWLKARVLEKKGAEYSIMFIGWDPKHDEDVDYIKQPWRFANLGTFSEKEATGESKDVGINQKVTINVQNFFDRDDETWVEGYVRKRVQGQVQVKFLYAPKSDKWQLRWFHLDTSDIIVTSPPEFLSVMEVQPPPSLSQGLSATQSEETLDFDPMAFFNRNDLVEFEIGVCLLDSEDRQYLRALLSSDNERLVNRNACRLVFNFGKACAPNSQLEMDEFSCDDVEDGKFISGFEALLVRIYQLQQMSEPPYDRVEEILTSLAQEICEENLQDGIGFKRIRGLLAEELIISKENGYRVTDKGKRGLDNIADFIDDSDGEEEEVKPKPRMDYGHDRFRQDITLDCGDTMDDLLASLAD